MKVLSVATTYSSLVLLFCSQAADNFIKTVNPMRKSCSTSNSFSPVLMDSIILWTWVWTDLFFLPCYNVVSLSHENGSGRETVLQTI